MIDTVFLGSFTMAGRGFCAMPPQILKGKKIAC